MSTVPLISLNDGNSIPAVGLGTFQGNYDYTTTNDLVKSVVSTAIDVGYRHIDTAYLYNTEAAIGEVIKNKISEGAVKREDLFITTKIWSIFHRRNDVTRGLKASLKELGLDYVDLALIHWPISLQPGDTNWPKDEQGNLLFEDSDTSVIDFWRGMEECKSEGLARSIGVSNFNIRQLTTILDNGSIKPVTNQVEVCPFFANRRLDDFCKKRDIRLTCFSPLGKPHRTWDRDGPFIFDNPVITSLAKKYNKTPAQVSLRFQTQRGLVVVPKSANVERQKQNLDIFDFSLTEDEMEKMFGCDMNYRVLWLDPLKGSKEYPYHEEV